MPLIFGLTPSLAAFAFHFKQKRVIDAINLIVPTDFFLFVQCNLLTFHFMHFHITSFYLIRVQLIVIVIPKVFASFGEPKRNEISSSFWTNQYVGMISSDWSICIVRMNVMLSTNRLLFLYMVCLILSLFSYVSTLSLSRNRHMNMGWLLLP